MFERYYIFKRVRRVPTQEAKNDAVKEAFACTIVLLIVVVMHATDAFSTSRRFSFNKIKYPSMLRCQPSSGGLFDTKSHDCQSISE